MKVFDHSPTAPYIEEAGGVLELHADMRPRCRQTGGDHKGLAFWGGHNRTFRWAGGFVGYVSPDLLKRRRAFDRAAILGT